IAGDQANWEPLRELRAPFAIYMHQARGRHITPGQERRLTGACHSLADALQMPTIHREIGVDFIPPRDPLFLLAGNAVDLLSARFCHFQQVMEMDLVGVVTQVQASEGADLQVLLLSSEKV